MELGEEGQRGQDGEDARGHCGFVAVVATPVKHGGDPSLVDALSPDLRLEMFPGKPGTVFDAVRAPPFAAKIRLGNVICVAVWLLAA